MNQDYKIEWLLYGNPRPVQLEANRRSYPKPGYALFMEMRLGKTAALLNEYLLFKRDYGIQRLLVLAPNKFKYGWYEEIKKFGMTEKVHVFESNKRDDFNIRADIIIVNYEALRSEENVKLLQKFRADMVVADESILIKNRTTHAFKRGYDLARNAKVARILTGKPVVQGPHDLWSQLRFIRELDGFNYYAFRNTFCKMGGWMAKQVVGYREENRWRLQDILSSCSFIASRKQWGTSFNSDYETRSLEILPQQAKHYREMENDFITWLNSSTAITADQALTKHIKLQQISSGFVIDEYKKIHEIVPAKQLPKLIDLKDSLENEVSHKALIICFYVHSVKTLLEQLQDFYPAFIGGTPLMKALGKDVEKEKAFFNTNPKCRIMIAQIQAVKYGHNLMGSKDDPCGEIFYYENTYSLDDRSQSEQRPQGEGQVEGLHIIDYASTKVEREIIKALQRKEKVSDAILKAYE